MPDAQPTKAMELARKWFRCPCGTPYGERRDYAGNSPPDDEPHAPEDFDTGVERMTAEIVAYAAERIEDRQRTIIEMLGAEPHTYEQMQAERDAAIAREEAAEADWRMEKGVRDALVERVQVLTGYIVEVRSMIDAHPKTAKMLLGDALAKAAAEPAAHKEER